MKEHKKTTARELDEQKSKAQQKAEAEAYAAGRKARFNAINQGIEKASYEIAKKDIKKQAAKQIQKLIKGNEL